MSLVSKIRKIGETLEAFRPDAEVRAGGARGTGLTRAQRSELRSGLFAAPRVRSFLDGFPFESVAVGAEIDRFVAGIDRAIGDRSVDFDAGAELLDEQRTKFLEELEAKLQGYLEVVEMTRPLRRFLGSTWGLTSTRLYAAVFDIWKHFAELDRHRRQIREIARRLGRLREIERRRFEKRLRESPGGRVWPLKRAEKSSVVGIRESDDLSSMLSSEAALLAVPETRPLFFLKFAEKKLLTYDYEVREDSPAARRPPRRTPEKILQRGPMIVAIDTSASMSGDREAAAKALALALTRIAMLQARAVHLVSFSSDTTELTLRPPKVSQQQLLHFLMLSFHGGTDIAQALDRGLARFEEVGFRRADLIFVSDAETPPFDPRRVMEMEQARARGHAFYGLVVGRHDNPELLGQLDACWRYDEAKLEEVVAGLDRYRLDRRRRSR